MPSELVGDDLIEDGPDHELRQFIVPDGQHGQRLDVVLTAQIPEFSRNYLQQLVEAGLVKVNGAIATKSSARLRGG